MFLNENIILTFKIGSVLYASCLGEMRIKPLKAKLFNNLNLSICVGTR